MDDYTLQEHLEEIYETFKVLYAAVYDEQLHSWNADLKLHGNNINHPQFKKCRNTIMWENLLKVLDVFDMVITKNIKDTKQEIADAEEEEYDKQLSRECEDFPEWYCEKPYAYTANGDIY